MKQKIMAFNQDDIGDWVAELACGHARHVRHRPPWQNRPWVLTEKSRAAMIGKELECGLCKKTVAEH
ncbi:MAG: DUF3565 domain-containing protein [Gammaproteobacteria bacterium]